jgi:hypothetical protein
MLRLFFASLLLAKSLFAERLELQFYTTLPQEFAWSSDNELLATADLGGGLSLWDLKTATRISSRQLPSGEPDHISFSPSAQTIALAGSVNSYLIETNSFKTTWEQPVEELQFIDEDRLLYIKDNSVCLLDRVSNEISHKWQSPDKEHYPRHLIQGADSIIYIVMHNRDIVLLERDSLRRIRTHKSSIGSKPFYHAYGSPKFAGVVIHALDGYHSLQFLRDAEEPMVRSLPWGGASASVIFDPAQFITWRGNKLTLQSLRNDNKPTIHPFPSEPSAASVSPDGSLLATSSIDGISLTKTRGFEHLATFGKPTLYDGWPNPIPASISPNGKDLFWSDDEGITRHFQFGEELSFSILESQTPLHSTLQAASENQLRVFSRESIRIVNLDDQVDAKFRFRNNFEIEPISAKRAAVWRNSNIKILDLSNEPPSAVADIPWSVGHQNIFSPDGRFILREVPGNNFVLWSIDDNRQITEVPEASRPHRSTSLTISKKRNSLSWLSRHGMLIGYSFQTNRFTESVVPEIPRIGGKDLSSMSTLRHPHLSVYEVGGQVYHFISADTQNVTRSIQADSRWLVSELFSRFLDFCPNPNFAWFLTGDGRLVLFNLTESVPLLRISTWDDGAFTVELADGGITGNAKALKRIRVIRDNPHKTWPFENWPKAKELTNRVIEILGQTLAGHEFNPE